MIYEQNTVRTLYKKLLDFYPGSFKEQLGESMEQTFNDLYNEQRHNRTGLLAPVLWIFIETTMGIFKEHLFLIVEGVIMQTILTNLRLPAIISFLIVLPFMILEVVNRRNFNQEFPFVLFGFLWVLPIIFISTVVPIVRNVRAGNNIIAKPIIFLLQIIVLTFIGWMWISIVIDQMPCFLGVPNCD